LGLINKLSDIARNCLRADLTIWLDVPLIESCRRRGGRLDDRIEGEGVAFLGRVVDGFEARAGRWDWIRINANQPVAAVTGDCCRAMVRQFGGFNE
jgi:dTMP kinase